MGEDPSGWPEQADWILWLLNRLPWLLQYRWVRQGSQYLGTDGHFYGPVADSDREYNVGLVPKEQETKK